MRRPRKILSFAREAGGAAAIAPVCARLRRDGWPLLLLAKGPALSGFADRGLDTVEIGEFSTQAVEAACRKHLGGLPEVVFTSATSLPTLDMTERLLWRWAAEQALPSAALIDQWQNYAIRFSGVGADERLAYLPDRILVMDAFARHEAEADGLPVERLVVTGQPAFDIIHHEHADICADQDLRAAHGFPAGGTVVTFAAESLRKDFGTSLGYDEQSTLAFLGDTLDALSPALRAPTLAIKLHPQNDPAEFAWARERWPRLNVRLFGRDITPRRIIAASDLVVGMSSIMLVEAILVGKPTVALELNGRREPQLVATRTGAIPHLRDAAAATKVLTGLLTDAPYRAQYLAVQNSWDISGNAVERCVDVLASIQSTAET